MSRIPSIRPVRSLMGPFLEAQKIALFPKGFNDKWDYNRANAKWARRRNTILRQLRRGTYGKEVQPKLRLDDLLREFLTGTK